MPASSQLDSPLYLGIDIGGTKCAVILGDALGNVVGRLERATRDGLDSWPAAAPTLISLISCLLKENQITAGDLKSIGVSCGGPLSSANGTILSPPNLPGWTEVPIRDFLSRQFVGLPVFVENDANATALAEHRWGAGKGYSSLAYLTCGTGIGAGIVLEGKLFRGKSDFAGEVGHAVIIPNGPLCLCGKRGCLEAIASGGAIGRIGAKFFGDPSMSGKDVINLAKSGNVDAVRVLREAAFYLGIGIANLLQTLDLELIIIGSLATYAGDEYLDTVRETVKENTWPSIADSAHIVCSGLGERTQDLAALAIALPMELSGNFAEQ